MAASPTLDAVRTVIVSAIKAGMNAGSPASVLTVHPYRRFWRDQQKFRSLFERQAPDLLPGKINGWLVTRTRTRETETEERWRFYNIDHWELHGYFGVQDEDATATEKVFQDQIEAIRNNLRLAITGTTYDVFGLTERTSPVSQVESIQPVLIGDSTCWFALLSLEAERIETKTI